MDAATRRELDELRRRAYGPDPDIADDPAAVARLIALEDLARPAPPAPVAAASAASERVAESDPVADRETSLSAADEAAEPETDATPAAAQTDAAASRPATPRSLRRRVALIAGVAGVLLVLVAAVQVGLQLSHRTTAAAAAPRAIPGGTAYHFISDPGSRIVARYSIDGFVPTPGQDERSIEVGEQFGWKLSILNTSDGSSCIVLTRKTTYRNCVSDSVLSTGGMMVALPYAAVPATDRPFGMRKSQGIGYWLLPDGRIMVVLGPSSLLDGG
ncbi:hypothetical protein [Microbacterium sp.]|uniref:hypothetical protein n=1 Tax=Microbacterium sp. TaxID=51671 RepID=UPI00092B287B|nr:hypothetical protein [Microbacterium sp.]MBN9193639.1 hypothetical protein [Microbacterium sp.]OJU63267.1 MAG: hypothetical protein BGO04_11400 [Microbacterium sp. 70-38]